MAEITMIDPTLKLYSEMIGRILTRIEGAEKDSETIDLFCSQNGHWTMLHQQDCCERVSVEDVIGDVADIIDSPITLFEEVSGEDPSPAYESATWTFYRIGTAKGSVTIRWYGSSNGYYSERVEFVTVRQPNCSHK